MIAGIAAGLGDYFDVDPVLFRVGFIVLTFVWGLAIPLYLAAWLLIPAEPGTVSTGRPRERVARRVGQWPRWLSFAVVAAGIAIVFARLGPRGNPWGFFGPDVVWGAALVLLGVLLYRHASQGDQHEAAPPEPIAGLTTTTGLTTATAPIAPWSAAPTESPRAEPPGSAWVEPIPPTTPTTPIQPPPPVVVAAPSPPRRRRERSALGWLTLGAVLLALGVAALADQAGTRTMAPVRFPALALTVIGVGLLTGTLWGRARWLAVFGVLLIPIVFAASLIDVPISGGVGHRFAFVTTASSLPPAYRLAAGELDIDAHNMRFDIPSATVTATVAAGRVRITAPLDTYVIVHAAVGVGTIWVRTVPFDPAGPTSEGAHVRLDQAYGSPAAANRLVLNLGVGFGQVDVTWAAPDQPLG
jgi:phage shock protein PspC (stress-responsive transcriptional regulator)